MNDKSTKQYTETKVPRGLRPIDAPKGWTTSGHAMRANSDAVTSYVELCDGSGQLMDLNVSDAWLSQHETAIHEVGEVHTDTDGRTLFTAEVQDELSRRADRLLDEARVLEEAYWRLHGRHSTREYPVGSAAMFDAQELGKLAAVAALLRKAQGTLRCINGQNVDGR